MTRKHFITLARVLSEARDFVNVRKRTVASTQSECEYNDGYFNGYEMAVYNVETALVEYFRAENVRFDSAKFRLACQATD